MANSSFAFWNFLDSFFALNIFNLRLVESMNVKSMDKYRGPTVFCSLVPIVEKGGRRGHCVWLLGCQSLKSITGLHWVILFM